MRCPWNNLAAPLHPRVAHPGAVGGGEGPHKLWEEEGGSVSSMRLLVRGVS